MEGEHPTLASASWWDIGEGRKTLVAKSTFQVRSAEECWIQQWMGGGVWIRLLFLISS